MSAKADIRLILLIYQRNQNPIFTTKLMQIRVKAEWQGIRFREVFKLPLKGGSLVKCSKVVELRTEKLIKKFDGEGHLLRTVLTPYLSNTVRKAISDGNEVADRLFVNLIVYFLLEFEASETKVEDDLRGRYLSLNYTKNDFFTFISAFEPDDLLNSPSIDEILEIISIITSNNHPFGHILPEEIKRFIEPDKGVPTKTEENGDKSLYQSATRIFGKQLIFILAVAILFLIAVSSSAVILFVPTQKPNITEFKIFPDNCDFKILVLPFRQLRKHPSGGSLDIGKEFTILFNNKADSLNFNLYAYYDSTINPETLTEEKVASIFKQTGADKIIYGLHDEMRFAPDIQIDSINIGYYIKDEKALGFPAHAHSGFFRTNAADFFNGNILRQVSLDDIIELNEIEYLIRKYILNVPKLDVEPLAPPERLNNAKIIFTRLENYIRHKDTENAYLWKLHGLMYHTLATRCYNLFTKYKDERLLYALQDNLTKSRKSLAKALKYTLSYEDFFYVLDLYMIAGHFNGYGPIKESDKELLALVNSKYGESCEYYYVVLVDFTFRRSLDRFSLTITPEYIEDTVAVAISFLEDLHFACVKKFSTQTQTHRYTFMMAEAYYFLKEFKKAESLCDRMLLDEPNSWGIRILKCRLLIVQKDMQSATLYLEKLIMEANASGSIIPNELNYQYFIILLAHKRLPEAKRFINKLNYEYPGHYLTWKEWIDYFGADIDIVDLRRGGYIFPSPPKSPNLSK